MSGVAISKIEDRMAVLKTYADSSLSAAENALSKLAGLDYSYITSISAHFDKLSPAPLSLPSTPGSLTISASPTLAHIATINKPTRPSISLPTAPSLATLTIPSAPAVVVPTMDTATLGDLMQITIPGAPTIDITSLSIEDPVPISISPATWTFTVGNILTSDDPMIKSAMARITNNIIYGGSGLLPAIEAAIYNRDLERNEQQLQDTTDKTISMWAKKGFSLPNGMLAGSLADIQKEYMNRRIDRSREIAIKQADMEQANIFKSLEMSVSLAKTLIDAQLGYQELIFKTQDATARYANEFVRLQIEAHRDVIEVFKARIQIYEATIRAQLAKAEVYHTQIQGELAKSQVNEQTVRTYTARIQAAIEKYKGELDADKIFADVFDSQIKGILGQSQIEESKVRAYAESLRGVLAAVDIYRADVDAMNAELGAEKIKIDANVAQINAWSKQVDAQIASFNAQMDVYRANAQFNISMADVQNKFAEVNVRSQIAEANVAIAAAETVSRSIQAAGNTAVEAAKAVAAHTSSMAAGAFAAMSVSAGMSYSESFSGQITQ